VFKHHVIPRLKPGGRKTLKDGFETQGVNLLFPKLDSFTEKKQQKICTQKKFAEWPLRLLPEGKTPVSASIFPSLFLYCFFIKNTIQGV
jgi:hypothetical protein